MSHEQRRLAAILAADVVGYSRMMGADEVGTIRALKAHRRELIDPQIAAHRGRIVKTMGDGVLVEFSSIVDAVTAAVAIQRGMAKRNAPESEDRRMVFRIGINVGDIVIDGNDIIGDSVNLAARLEALCEPGAICISQGAHDHIRDKLAVAFTDLGERTVKNIARPVGVFGLKAHDIANLATENIIRDTIAAGGTDAKERSGNDIVQRIRFCKIADGTELAWSVIGSGPTLVKTGNWMTHLEKDIESPIWRHLWRDLAKNHTVVRYDARGCGLSDWTVKDISFAAFVGDLETVIDAAGVERFDLFGISQGCAVSIAYAASHPERVKRLVLYGGFAQGPERVPSSPAATERRAAMRTLMRLGWGKKNPAFRQLFTSQFVPDANKEQADWFNDLERISASPENAVRFMDAIDQFDVMALLPKITAPTLVMHAREDLLVPFEAGRRMAAGIPGARFVPLESRNHGILEHEPAYAHFIAEMEAFLSDER